MRVTTKAIFDIETGECLSRESYDYNGPIESCDPVTITAIAAIVGASTSAGLGIYNTVNKPEAPAQPSPAEVTKQAISQEETSRGAATKQASQFLPMLQSNTSGGLSPDAYRELSANFSGNANLADSSQMKQLIAKFLGLDTGASFGGSEPFGSGGATSGTFNPASPGLTG